MDIRWALEVIEHIQKRSARYPDAVNIEVDWADEAYADPHKIVRDPDPMSGPGIVRVIGYSRDGDCVVTVIAEWRAGELWGRTAWKTSGRDLRDYKEAADDHPADG